MRRTATSHRNRNTASFSRNSQIGVREIVVLVAVTPGGELLLVEQHREAVGGPVIELPAGLAGDDSAAKQTVKGLLGEFGWAEDTIVDLGGIRAARATEMYLPLWLTLFGLLGTGDFNIGIVRA